MEIEVEVQVPDAKEIKYCRNQLGMTQGELAERAGISQAMLSRIEGNDVDPRLSTVKAIADAINSA